MFFCIAIKQSKTRIFMKAIAVNILFTVFCMISMTVSAQLDADHTNGYKVPKLYIDVHRMPGGKVNFDDVAGAHKKDLAVQDKYGVKFIKYWVDEKSGSIYCLASANDSSAIRSAHSEAHGLLPEQIYAVTEGISASEKNGKQLFVDVHEFGAGHVSAKDVAEAHKKDLAVQKKYGVNFINYWVDEKAGVVMCLSQAKDEESVRSTHKEAHGLMPSYIQKVKQGN
jgi:hypothetical protein